MKRPNRDAACAPPQRGAPGSFAGCLHDSHMGGRWRDGGWALSGCGGGGGREADASGWLRTGPDNVLGKQRRLGTTGPRSPSVMKALAYDAKPSDRSLKRPLPQSRETRCGNFKTPPDGAGYRLFPPLPPPPPPSCLRGHICGLRRSKSLK